MKIIKGPTYPEANRAFCKNCSCEFMYLDNEIELGGDELFGGYGIWSGLKCPGCNALILLKSQFIEYDNRFKLKWRNR